MIADSAGERSMRRLVRPGGGFCMLALDQRESLRSYLAAARAGADTAAAGVDDAELVAFKRHALGDLGDVASGVLLDLDYGLPALGELGAPLAGGLVVAADVLEQQPGGPVESTTLDERVDAALLQRSGAVALKLLVVWRRGRAERARREALVGAFVHRCAELGMLSLLEGALDEETRAAARRDGGGRIFAAMAEELCAAAPDLYKTEVPAEPALPAAAVTAGAELISAIAAGAGCPWVLLSSGVEPEQFAAVAAACCAGGASGVLAGRAVWRGSLTPSGYDAGGSARRRLEELTGIVDRTARPFGEVRASRSSRSDAATEISPSTSSGV
jgi:sulfofructosephosphate aldolase